MKCFFKVTITYEENNQVEYLVTQFTNYLKVFSRFSFKDETTQFAHIIKTVVSK